MSSGVLSESGVLIQDSKIVPGLGTIKATRFKILLKQIRHETIIKRSFTLFHSRYYRSYLYSYQSNDILTKINSWLEDYKDLTVSCLTSHGSGFTGLIHKKNQILTVISGVSKLMGLVLKIWLCLNNENIKMSFQRPQERLEPFLRTHSLPTLIFWTSRISVVFRSKDRENFGMLRIQRRREELPKVSFLVSLDC